MDLYTIIIITLGMVLVLLVVAYLPLMKWALSSQSKEKAILDEATNEAQKIIQSARDEAGKIVADTAGVAGKTEKVLENKLAGIVTDVQSQLEKDSDDHLREYSKTLEGLENQNLHTVQNISKDLSEESKKAIEELREKLEAELNAERNTMINTLAVIREQRLKQLDDEIITIVDSILRKVFASEPDWKRESELISSAILRVKEVSDQKKIQ